MSRDDAGHEAIRETIAAYALDALDPGERARAEHELVEHLPGCPDCSALLRDLREVAGDLALGAGARAPSPTFERRLLSGVAASQMEGRPTPRRRLALRTAGVAAALLLAASVAVNGVLAARLGRVEGRVRGLEPLLEAAGGPGSRAVPLQGGRGTLALVYRAGGPALLVGRDLPSPPAGMVFELWLLGARPVPVTTFRPDRGVVTLALRRDPTPFRGVAVTVERGLVESPTGPPLFSAVLPS